MAARMAAAPSSPAGPGLSLVAGVDEAGRGPLAGPVVAAAVILSPARPIDGLADSKQLCPRRRAALRREIAGKAMAWAVGIADVAEIDSINILEATMLAMRRAILGLRLPPTTVEVDGNRLPDLAFGSHSVIGRAIVSGDALVPAISAASIIAKEFRDEIMLRLDAVYPQYGFRQHKGYGTRLHREAIAAHGPCPQHRRSFRMPAADGLKSAAGRPIIPADSASGS